MNEYDAIKETAARAGVSLRAASLSMGKSGDYISIAIRNGRARGSRLKVDTLENIAHQFGYAVALVPADNIPSDAIELD